MALRDGLMVGALHHLFIGGCDAVSLAEEYGTPLYVLDELYIREMCRTFMSAMNTYAPGGMVHYASKAFSSVALCKIIAQEGLGLDVVSGGELITALEAGVPMERVTLHGNSKTAEEVYMAMQHGVGNIVIDNRSEIPMLQAIAAELDIVVKVQLRMNPGIDAHTHKSVLTATTDCKFGMGIDDGEAQQAVVMLQRCPNLLLTGVHIHIGSQIFDLEPYLQAVDRLTDFMMLATAVYGKALSDLIVGGGFGVRYTGDDPPTVNPHEVIRILSRAIQDETEKKGLPLPRLVLEPGRIIVAEAGVALYRVCSIKHIANSRTYIGIDGGMTDNPRYALYGSKYEALLANRADVAPVGEYAIAGRACESGDVLGYDFLLPEPSIGDIIAVPTAGAYQYSMASNYNRVPFPAVVLARYGKSAPIVRRQRYEEVMQYDQVPSWLK